MFEYFIDDERASSLEKYITAAMQEINVGIDREQMTRLIKYDAMLMAANKISRLTALSMPEDIAKKHFADSALPISADVIADGASVIDIGTGAGFPGIVLKILRNDIKITLLDSLKKRCDFLRFCCNELEIEADIVDERAEIAASNIRLRDSFDIAVSRAVSEAAVLCEICLPFVNIGGKLLAYKGHGAVEEFLNAGRCIKTLGAEMGSVMNFKFSWGERSIAIVNKKRKTPKNYPRRPGDAKRRPIEGELI